MSLDEALDTIQQMHPGATIETVKLPTGRWMAELSTDDWSVTAEGATEGQARAALVKRAKEDGRG